MGNGPWYDSRVHAPKHFKTCSKASHLIGSDPLETSQWPLWFSKDEHHLTLSSISQEYHDIEDRRSTHTGEGNDGPVERCAVLDKRPGFRKGGCLPFSVPREYFQPPLWAGFQAANGNENASANVGQVD